MFGEKWKPLFDIAEEAGSEEVTETPEIDETSEEPPEGKLSGRSAIRKSLEKGFEDERKAGERDEKGKFKKIAKRLPGGGIAEPEEGEETEVETPEEGEEVTPAVAAPEGISKEAAAEWAKTPKPVQEAFLKRVADMDKGVKELQGKYSDLDTALQPHMNAIRQHGHTPAQAVSQLFGWFQALAGNPDVAFPALAKSFGYDMSRFAPAGQQQQPAAGQTAQPGAEGQPTGEQISPAMQKYIDDMKKEVTELKNQFGGFQTNVQRRESEQTNEILANWSKDKPHFQAVREDMAALIQTGRVPLKNGQVDLDGAYERAIWANPEVRAKLIADQQAAEAAERKKKADEAKKKAAADAEKARKAGVGVGGGAPGEAAAGSGKSKGKGKSVRESIMEAREQLTD